MNRIYFVNYFGKNIDFFHIFMVLLCLNPQNAETIQEMIMDDSPSLLVSKRLKAFRKKQGYTLRTLSEKSGVAVNTISLIERRKTSPTISTLHKLATALDARLTEFCEEKTKNRVIYTKKNQRQEEQVGAVFMGHLGKGLTNLTMSPMLLTFLEEANSGPEPMTHEGHELAFCLNGRIRYEVNGEQYLLEPGDSLLFEAQLPHRWENANGASSQALMILQKPDNSENIQQFSDLDLF